MQEMITTKELEVRLIEKKRRAEYMQTANGIARAKQLMLEKFEYLRICGYKLPDADPNKMAEIWADQMKAYIVRYGSDVICEAVKSFVANDHRDYRQAPNPTQIIDEAKKIGFNPDVEYARKQYEAEVERMVQEQKEHVQAEMTPERRAELVKRFPNMASAIGAVYGD